MADESTASSPAYEFTSEQGRVIGDLGRAMRLVGLVVLAYSIAGIILLAIAAWRTGIIAIDLNPLLGILIGAWALSGAHSFLDVATTQGNDIPHLMAALTKLRQIFWLIAVLMIVALVLAVVVLAVIAFTRPENASISVFGHPIR
ncbi:MAG: hypothetical protein U0790_11255 [Isosphaeraceae bacterium]